MQMGRYNTTFDVYRPFGAGAALTTGNACRLIEQMDEGRRPDSSGLNWSHYLECELSVDVRDGVLRTAGANSFTYADGDEVRIPDSTGTSYAVVFVIVLALGSTHAYKRAFLLRDAPRFSGSGWT